MATVRRLYISITTTTMENPNKLKRPPTPLDLISLGICLGIFIGHVSIDYGIIDHVVCFMLGGFLIRLIYKLAD